MINMLFLALATTRAVPMIDDVALVVATPALNEQPAGGAAQPASAPKAADAPSSMSIRWSTSTAARPDPRKVTRISKPGGAVPEVGSALPQVRRTRAGALIVPLSSREVGGGRVIVVNPAPEVPESNGYWIPGGYGVAGGYPTAAGYSTGDGRPGVGERDQYGRLIIARADQVMRAFDKRFGIGVVGRFNNGNNPFPLFPNLPQVNIAPAPLDPSKLPSEQARASILTISGRDPRELPSRQIRQPGSNSPFGTPQIDPTKLPSEQLRGAVVTPGGRDPRELPSRQQ